MHWSHNDLFSQVTESKDWHEKSKINFEKAVNKTAEEHGQTPKKVENQTKEESKDILNK